MELVWEEEISDYKYSATAVLPPKSKLWAKNRDYLQQNNFSIYKCEDWIIKYTITILSDQSKSIYANKRDNIIKNCRH